MKNLQEFRNVADWKWISGDILSFSLFEGKKLKIDTFVELHMHKFFENATVDFLFLFENVILL